MGGTGGASVNAWKDNVDVQAGAVSFFFPPFLNPPPLPCITFFAG